MVRRRPATVAGYIAAAPARARPHLQRVRAILRSVAPHADEVIKWGTPFYVDPRFLFAFSAHREHCNFAPTAAALAAFRAELGSHRTTANFLQLPYDRPLPEQLIRRIAKYRLAHREEGEGFW